VSNFRPIYEFEPKKDGSKGIFDDETYLSFNPSSFYLKKEERGLRAWLKIFPKVEGKLTIKGVK